MTHVVLRLIVIISIASGVIIVGANALGAMMFDESSELLVLREHILPGQGRQWLHLRVDETRSLTVGSTPIEFSIGVFNGIGEWFPDGSALLSHERENSAWNIIRVDEEGNRLQLTQHPANDFALGWSPDGETLLFLSDRDASARAFYTMHIDGTNIQQISPPLDPVFISWSPSGDYILYAVNIPEPSSRLSVYVLNVNTGESTQIADRNGQFSWSPDGQFIAYTTNVTNGVILYNMTTNEAERITEISGGYHNPQWSPTGEWLMFESLISGSNNIYLWNPETQETSELIPSVINNSARQWSPDGDKVLYQSATNQRTHLVVVDLEANTRTVLTTTLFRDIPTAILSSRNAMWSPDNESIVFPVTIGRVSRVYSVNADGTSLRPLTAPFNNMFDIPVQWRPQ